jgi:hypothetical protein
MASPKGRVQSVEFYEPIFFVVSGAAPLRLLTERYVRQGMTEAEAARAARRQFGNVTLLQEAHRERFQSTRRWYRRVLLHHYTTRILER